MPEATMNEPVGLHCPGCGQPAALAFDEQAWCGTEDCHVVMWNPTKTLAEMANDIQQIKLPGGDDA